MFSHISHKSAPSLLPQPRQQSGGLGFIMFNVYTVSSVYGTLPTCMRVPMRAMEMSSHFTPGTKSVGGLEPLYGCQDRYPGLLQ